MEDHLAHLEQVLTTLQANTLYLKKSKCAFGQETIDYLGHIVSVKGVQPDPQKVAAVQSWPTPTTLKQL